MTKMKKRYLIFAFAYLSMCSFLSSFPAWAEDGVFPDKIIFGQTAAQEGTAAVLGLGMHVGIMAAFQQVNEQGGINGRKLELIAYDDGYEPEQAIRNTQKLIDEDHIFALIGGMGTPTAYATEPIASANKVPLIGQFTGAEFLRSPYKRYVVNIRGSYWQETEELIKHLTKDLGLTRIAILYQDDSFGRSGLSGVQQALEKRGLSLAGEATYKRNTVAVKSAVLRLRKVNPEAVVMISTDKPSMEFIRISNKIGFTPKFVSISAVGSVEFAKELGALGDGVIISQVVPLPYESTASALVHNYQAAMTAYKPEEGYSFLSMEGYMVGRFVAEILKHMDGDITRESFLDKVYEMGDVPLDDITLHYGPEDNQGMDKVFITVLQKDGSLAYVKQLSR